MPARPCWGLAALLSTLVMSPALAQTAAPPPIAVPSATAAPADADDPSLPLPPLPDLGVEWPTADAPAADAQAAASENPSLVRYDTEITGLAELRLLGEFRAASALLASKDPANLAQIQQRAKADVALAIQLIRSRGYYDGTAITLITPAEGRTRTKVTLTVTPGEPYRYAEVKLAGPPEIPAGLDAELRLAPGDLVDAEATLAGEARVKLALPNLGYPFAEVGPLDILIDHDRRAGFLTLPVEPGPPAVFGTFVQTGEPDLGQRHLAHIARFNEGDPYRQDRVDDFRRALIATGLYSSVSVTPRRDGPAVGDRVKADLAITATPASLRTIAGEIGYDTLDGIRTEASWRHRNLVPPEGAVTVRGVAGTREFRIGADLIKSNFKGRDRYLTTRFDIADQNTDAFDSRNANASVTYERRSTQLLQKWLTWYFGAEVFVASERDYGDLEDGRQEYYLVAFPLGVGLDDTQSLLDPTSGYRVDLRFSPELSFRGDYSYLRTRLTTSAYQPVGDRTVLAVRAATGAIIGADRSEVPPSRRYYVGGGGSVRGYGYQDIGPEDADGNPTGGRSFVELSGEVRYRISDTIGVVGFLDAGALYLSEYPQFGNFQYGIGIGARYFTSVGPIRVDIATPVNPRSGDPNIALYFSIGQAF